MNGKGSRRRPEASPGAYARGWQRVYGKLRRLCVSQSARNTVPPPGSPAAVRAGCTCPVLDNQDMPKGLRWQSDDCPLHGAARRQLIAPYYRIRRD